MELSDKTILELQSTLAKANMGNQDAFGVLINRFETRFQQLVRKMLADFPRVKRWEATDDVYQAAIVRLHRSLTGAKPKTVREFVGLAATQIRRTLLDLTRHYFGARGHGANYRTSGGGKAADDPGGPIETASRSLQPESLEDWTLFHEATKNLPADPRETFELIWYAGMQQNEVAQLLNVSRRTIIRRLQQARQLLAESLQAEAE